MDEFKKFDEQMTEDLDPDMGSGSDENEILCEEAVDETAEEISAQVRQEPKDEAFVGEVSADKTAEREQVIKELRQKRAAFRKTAALGLVGAVLFGVSIGTSMGISYNSSRNLFLRSAQPFDFETQTSEISGQAAASSVDITPTNNDVIDVINKVKNSVVNISITARSQGFFGESYESEGAGSGIVYSQDDEKVYIVTNNHVIEDADEVSISITGEETVKASLVGRDPSADLAVIYVLKSDLKAAGINDVTPAVFGDSDSVQVGEYVVAIGNALGEGKTTTRGIISAENKTINVDGKHLEMIQTDAAINPGNSGGALVNSAGQVIGINTAKYSSYSIEGTGFAIPVNIAKDTITQLVETGSVDKPYLGIVGYTIDEEFKERYSIDVEGAFITAVDEGGAADKAGLRRSDIITAIDGVKVKSVEELSNEIKKRKSGDTVTLSVIRNGVENMEIKATLKNYNEEF